MRYAIKAFANCNRNSYSLFIRRARSQSKVDLTLGWTYERAAQNPGYANLNGWFGSLSYNALSYVGFTFEHESYWGAYNHESQNQHVWLGGLTIKPLSPDRKIGFFIQPTIGDTRSSSAGVIQNSFTFQLATGADIKMTKMISLEITPAEYVLTDQNGPQSSYGAALGVQFSLGKR